MITGSDGRGVILPALLSQMLERLGVDAEGARANRGFAGASRRWHVSAHTGRPQSCAARPPEFGPRWKAACRAALA
jgi:hypothetical protein